MAAFIRNQTRLSMGLSKVAFESTYSNLAIRGIGSTVARARFSTDGNSKPNNSDDSSSKPRGTVSGIVNSILHGSGTLSAKMQSQESWGVSLARGKYVHELQKHRIKPERFEDYVQLVSEVFPRMVKESNSKIRLTGSWLTEIGEQDTAGKFKLL
ncbi:hypothetical protein BGZ76_002083 [Entomortierella beljakovae]|nr:hypothetical protein BGZ76_002083 [Entomortierella beljakovae]